MRRLKEVGANFESIQEPFLNTTNANPYSEFLRGLFASLSQLELQKGERSKAGQDAARSRNKQMGRKKGLNEKGKQDLILVKSYFLEKNNTESLCVIANTAKS